MANDPFPAGLPGFRRADCLGCGQRVVGRRDAWVPIVGTRDGSWLSVLNVEPYLGYADDLPAPPQVLVLGVAHRRCWPLAKQRLRAGDVVLPDDLPKAIADSPTLEKLGLDNLGLVPARDRCAYCGELSTSDEHVFPLWLSGALRGWGGFTMRDRGRTRAMRTIPVTTTQVCGSCNNGWLSVLENDCKPIIEPMLLGRERHLSEADQERVAAWAYKTALMLDLMGDGAVPLGYFRKFANDRTAPDSAVTWMGAYIGKNAAVAYEQPLQMGAPSDQLPLALVSTFAVGRLLFQVFQHFTKGGADLKDDRAAAVALDRIWPVLPAFTWPRERIGFNDDELRALADSINPGGSC